MGATLEEDAEGFALRSLVERDGVRPDVVLLAEATDLSLRRGQRGRCEVRVRTNGRAVHASTPQLGESAILKMMPVIAALEAMNADLPTHPIFGKGTQVISLIEGPHTPNSVPSWCEVTVDRRMMPGETMASVLAGIRAVVEPLGATAGIPDQPVHTHTGARLDGPSFYPGWLLEETHPLLAAGQATGQSAVGRAATGGRLALLHRRHLLGRRGGHPDPGLWPARGALRARRRRPGRSGQADESCGVLRALSMMFIGD